MAKPKTKDEIISKLTELGIEFDPKSTKDELLALLPVEADSDTTAVDSDSASVCDMHGNVARTYTKELHGDDFRTLAEEFAKKHEGWTVR